MRYQITKRGENPLFSIIIVDSRSDEEPGWVKKAVKSALNQSEHDLELILIDNRDKTASIGKCYNLGLTLASGKWVYYLGDDDYISPDYIHSLKVYAEKFCTNNDVIVSTYCTFFDDDLQELKRMDKMPMGAYRKEYFLNHPFNETLKRYIDIDAIERATKNKKLIRICPFHYGYYYRQHSSQISGRKQILDSDKMIYDVADIKKDFYIVDSLGQFSEEIKNHFDAVRTRDFLPELAKQSKIIWCEWADENAVNVSKWGGSQIKILRIHAYEVFTDYVYHINFKAFDYILTGSEYIANVLRRKVGALNNIHIVSVGVDLGKFTFNESKDPQKVGYAGFITRKKGSDKIIDLAYQFPHKDFYLKGEFQEEDFRDWFLSAKPENVHIEPWGDKVNEFFQDKAFVLSVGIRESFHRALAEGMATGCKPIIRNWIGAESIYSRKWIFNKTAEIYNLFYGDRNPCEYRDFIKRYDLKNSLAQIENLIGAANDTCGNARQIENIAG